MGNSIYEFLNSTTIVPIFALLCIVFLYYLLFMRYQKKGETNTAGQFWEQPVFMALSFYLSQ